MGLMHGSWTLQGQISQDQTVTASDLAGLQCFILQGVSCSISSHRGHRSSEEQQGVSFDNSPRAEAPHRQLAELVVLPPHIILVDRGAPRPCAQHTACRLGGGCCLHLCLLCGRCSLGGRPCCLLPLRGRRSGLPTPIRRGLLRRVGNLFIAPRLQEEMGSFKCYRTRGTGHGGQAGVWGVQGM